jgi:integrase/recombinase XerD
LRISLKTSDKREALRREKMRIADAQNGRLESAKTVGLTVPQASKASTVRRTPLVAPRTLELEQGAVKHLSRHYAAAMLAKLDSDALAGYVGRRKAEGVGNRTVNIEVGVLRRVLKQFKLWHLVGEDYKPLPEPKDIGRALTPEQELNLFSVASTRREWTVAFWVSLVAANTTAGGCEIRNLRLQDIDLQTKTLYVRVGKNKFRVRAIPLNCTATWAVERLVDRAHKLGATDPEHYLIPRRVAGKQYDPLKPPSRWAWRSAWRKLTRKAGLDGLRPHDLRHHAITKLAESSEAGEQTIMAIAGHVSREMLEHYSHIRQEAKRRAVESLDNVTITSQLDKWKRRAEQQQAPQVAGRKRTSLVGARGFEPRTPCAQGRCATRLRYAPLFSTTSDQDYQNSTSCLEEKPMTKHEEFLQQRQYLQNVSHRTMEWHRQSLKWLALPNPDEGDLKNVVIRMRKAGLKASSVNCRLRSINAYLAWIGSGLRVPKLMEEEFLPETFSAEDIAKFAQARPTKRAAQRAKLLVLTLADTGLRLSEALNLRWTDVDWDNCLLTVIRKGRKERRIPFSMELRKVLYRTNPSGGDGFIFGTNQGTHLGPRDARRDVSKLCTRLGIKQPKRLLHAFRHSWASNAVREGMNPFVLQRLLGHTTMQMTNKYVSLGTSDLHDGHISLLG